jgi:hypothetical protein
MPLETLQGFRIRRRVRAQRRRARIARFLQPYIVELGTQIITWTLWTTLEALIANQQNQSGITGERAKDLLDDYVAPIIKPSLKQYAERGLRCVWKKLFD